MLVENAAGDAALLGRPRSLRGRGAVLTCLSGFIEQVCNIVSRSRSCRIFLQTALHGDAGAAALCYLGAAEC